jgi:electron transfer flavoprotein beta subunit
VKEGINLPRYPTLKGRLDSKKVAVESVTPEGDAGGQQLVTLKRPVEKANETTILGTGPDAASAIVDLLVELGVA